jgi:Trypsin-co-occurring domain 1
MDTLVRFEISAGHDVLVEVDSADEGLVPVGRGRDGIVHAAGCFSDRLDSIRDAVSQALTRLEGPLNPDKITVSFGIRFTAEAGAVIAKTSVEGNLGVEMVWQRAGEP